MFVLKKGGKDYFNLTRWQKNKIVKFDCLMLKLILVAVTIPNDPPV